MLIETFIPTWEQAFTLAIEYGLLEEDYNSHWTINEETYEEEGQLVQAFDIVALNN